MSIEKLHCCENCDTKTNTPSKIIGWIILDVQAAVFYKENNTYPGMAAYKQHGKKVLDFCSFNCFVEYFRKYTT